MRPFQWLSVIRAMTIPTIILLVTACRSSPLAAPAPTPQPVVLAASTPEPIAFDTPTPEAVVLATSTDEPLTFQTPTLGPLALATSTPHKVFVPLVNGSVSTDTPELAATVASATAIPLPTNPPSPLPTPTPTLAFARPITVSASAPISDGQARIVSVPILMYHYISVPPPGSDRYRRALSVTPVSFEAQMSYLQQVGYHAITLYDLYDYLMQGKPLPEKPIILTFDDGYVDAITSAMPILQKHGFVGTFFVLTGPADRGGAGGYLTWDHIVAMNAAGMDIELHSREHYDLRCRSNDFLVHQIAGGKESIEAHINRPVRWFAYPSGRYDAAVIRVLKSAGFWGAVTTAYGRTYTATAFFEMPRVRINGSYTLETFKKVVADGQ